MAFGKHCYRVGNEEHFNIQMPNKSIDIQKKHIEPWLASVLQSEHLALLLGSGFTKAVARQAGTSATDMACDYDGFPLGDELKDAAQQAPKAMGRGDANIEDHIRAANALSQGLKILGDDRDTGVISARDALLNKFLNGISKTERDLKSAVEKSVAPGSVGTEQVTNVNADQESEKNLDPLVMLVSFLLSFSSRTATRERLHVFTTNYDRLIEYGADLAGLHLLDRFVGSLEPILILAAGYRYALQPARHTWRAPLLGGRSTSYKTSRVFGLGLSKWICKESWFAIRPSG